MQRFAAVQRLQSGEGVGVLFDDVRQLQETLGTSFGRGLPPLPEGAIGGLYRGIHLLRAGFGNLQQHLAGGRIIDGLLLT